MTILLDNPLSLPLPGSSEGLLHGPTFAPNDEELIKQLEIFLKNLKERVPRRGFLDVYKNGTLFCGGK
jgi:hypothetical protein